MEKIIAVVVSHNRHSSLVKCIDAIRNQTHQLDAILVVNNGSVDFTSVWLDNQSDVFQLYQDNLGSAGGYHAGIKWAYDKGYSLIWCMDDDGYPKENALEILLQHKSHETELLNCAVINIEDKKSFVSKTKNYKTINDVKENCIKGICHPFNGTLIHRSIIEKAGLPLANLFYWGEEREYFYRIANTYKIPVKTVTQSIHYHPELSNAQKKEWDYQSSWKMYFYVRNRYKVLQSKYSFKFFAFISYMFFLLFFIKSILIYQKKNKFRKMAFVLWPVSDSLQNNFVDTPESIEKIMTASNKKSIISLLFNPVKKFILTLFVPSYADGSKNVLIEL
jgi:rhamnopyranosyl-N-acetylglucosaminyl-diphospho-decaprenol beta-1,3/1,4-galactofuranosyltransferase